MCVCAFVLCFARRRMQLGGKKLHREGTVNRCVFDFLRTVGIFETSCFEFFVLFQKKKTLLWLWYKNSTSKNLYLVLKNGKMAQ